jgi:hypothetical protein
MTRCGQGPCLGIAVVLVFALTGCGGGSSNSGGGGTGAQPSFALSASPNNPSVGQGGAATTTITVVPQNGFTGTVALSATGLPAGVSAAFNPASTTTTSVLTLTSSSSSATGTTSVTVTGTSGSLMPTTPVSLTVAAPSVSVSVSPSLAAVAATTQTQQFSATVTGNMGNSSVNWSVDGTAGGNSTVGTINSAGLYMPPSTGGNHTVTATSAALSTATGSASIAVTDLAGVFTYHNDLARDGVNTQEYALTTSTVNSTTFGKLFSCPVDGAVYAQPLWVPGFSIGGGVHNLLIVATQHDSVFAFDADASPCVTYWQANLLDTLHGGTAGEGPVVWNDVGYCYGDIYPEVGVTATPVIDPTTNILYVVGASEIPGSQSGNCSLPAGTYFHRLHALDLATGSEQSNSPVTIAASLPGTGDGSSGGMVSFSSQLEHNRPGLALSGGNIYVAFAAHEDATPYHGWVIGYSAANVQTLTSVFNTTPNGSDGGVWAGGGAPAIDDGGDIYITTGNGMFDESPPPPENDYGDSIVRLHPFSGTTANGSNLNVAGWFTPDDQLSLSDNDADLGSGAAVLLPDQTSGPVTHLLVQVGKAQPGAQGMVYLVDRDSMGQYNSANNNVVQGFYGPHNGVWGTPAFWQNTLYVGGTGDLLKAFSFNPSTGLFTTIPASEAPTAFRYPGNTPSVSALGTSNGIVWALDSSLYGYASGGSNCQQSPLPSACSGPAILHAYNATNLASELWNSSQAANNRDQAGNAVKFIPPTIANGKVYVGTVTEVDVYGLLPN